MSGEWLASGVTLASPFLLAVFAWLTKRRIDNRAADDTSLEMRLNAQRADFQAVVGPLQEGYKSLQERVQALEDRVTRAEGDAHVLTVAFRDTLEYMSDRYDDPGPVLPERVNRLIKGSL